MPAVSVALLQESETSEMLKAFSAARDPSASARDAQAHLTGLLTEYRAYSSKLLDVLRSQQVHSRAMKVLGCPLGLLWSNPRSRLPPVT